MRAGVVVFLVLGATLLTSCMPSSYRQARKLEGRYQSGEPGNGWKRVAAGGADNAWFNEDIGASIYTDSNCGPRYQESRVEDLATELVAGIFDLTTERDELLNIGDRQGVLRVHHGTLDGLTVALAVGVVNRNTCNYDFTYIATPETFERGWDAYLAVINGFEVR